MAEEPEWDSLGQAALDAVGKIKALGAPESSHKQIHEIIWRVAVWQGSRERRRARIEFAEQIGALARDNT